MKIFSYMINAFAILGVIIGVAGLVSYFLHPASYRFGTEVSGLAYKTHIHYVSVNLATVLCCLAVIVASLQGKMKLSMVLIVMALILAIVGI